MDAELAPREDLDELLQRADPARHGHEAVRQLSHQRLALVHGVDDLQPGHRRKASRLSIRSAEAGRASAPETVRVSDLFRASPNPAATARVSDGASCEGSRLPSTANVP